MPVHRPPRPLTPVTRRAFPLAAALLLLAIVACTGTPSTGETKISAKLPTVKGASKGPIPSPISVKGPSPVIVPGTGTPTPTPNASASLQPFGGQSPLAPPRFTDLPAAIGIALPAPLAALAVPPAPANAPAKPTSGPTDPWTTRVGFTDDFAKALGGALGAYASMLDVSAKFLASAKSSGATLPATVTSQGGPFAARFKVTGAHGLLTLDQGTVVDLQKRTFALDIVSPTRGKAYLGTTTGVISMAYDLTARQTTFDFFAIDEASNGTRFHMVLDGTAGAPFVLAVSGAGTDGDVQRYLAHVPADGSGVAGIMAVSGKSLEIFPAFKTEVVFVERKPGLEPDPKAPHDWYLDGAGKPLEPPAAGTDLAKVLPADAALPAVVAIDPKDPVFTTPD